MTNETAASEKKNSRKATHIGECQGCGRVQKLPNDKLSLHGYTVRWGFFEGRCPASKLDPFEVSIDYIDTAIANAQAEASRLRDCATDVLAQDNGKAWVHVYGGRNSRLPSGYHWVEGVVKMTRITPEDIWTDVTVDYPVRVSEWSHDDTHGMSHKDVTVTETHNVESYALRSLSSVSDIAHKLNEGRAKMYRDAAVDYDRYVVWQQTRTKNWQPSALRPVKKV